MDEKMLEALSAKIGEVVAENLSDENIKGVLAPMVGEEVKSAMANLSIDKAIFARDKSGVSEAAKKDFAERVKAMSEGTTTAGGFLVPTEIQKGILRLVEDFGLIRKYATIIPMSTDTLNLPRLTTSVTAYWPGENTEGTASDPVLGNVSLVAKTLVGLTAVSNELLADANISVTDYLMVLFAEAFAGEEDKQGLVGTGSPFTGLLADTGVTVVNMASTKDTFIEVAVDDLRALIAAVKPTALVGAGFIMHRAVWAIVQLLRENSILIAVTATPVITGQDNPMPMGVVGYIWGYPVYLSEKMPSTTAVSTKFIAFGNLKHIILGDRAQIEIAKSDAATVGGVNAFAANQQALRMTERIAIAVGLPTAFAVLKTAAS